MIQLPIQPILKDLDLSVIEVIAARDFKRPAVLVLLPVLAAGIIPFLHKLLILLHLSECFLTLVLLQTHQHRSLRLLVADRLLVQVGFRQLVLQQFLLDQLQLLAADRWPRDAVLSVDGR